MKPQSPRPWTAEDLLDWAAATKGRRCWPLRQTWTFSAPFLLRRLPAAKLARKLQCDLCALTILLDALVALRLLEKADGQL